MRGIKVTKNVLAVNPRKGERLADCIISGVMIDSFVSDPEWVGAARDFSDKVYHGYSHHPLMAVDDNTYDDVLVCEDLALLDDVDRMLQVFYRVLRPGGEFICELWNMSYIAHIQSFLTGKGAQNLEKSGFPCGYSGIPLDCLTMRLNHLGFHPIELSPKIDKETDVQKLFSITEQHSDPLTAERFSAVSYRITATKQGVPR